MSKSDRIAPHINQIERDLRSMTQHIQHHVRKIEERHEYVRLEGAAVRAAIADLRGALDKLSAKF